MLKVDTFPPVVCRLLARDPKLKAKLQRPLSDVEISRASGLRVDQVIGISWFCTWENIPVDTMKRFAAGCGIDFADYKTMQKHYRFVGRMAGRWLTGKHYLRRDKEWETKWKPLIENYIGYIDERIRS